MQMCKHTQVGDTLPDVTVFEDSPAGAVKLRDVFAGKKVGCALAM